MPCSFSKRSFTYAMQEPPKSTKRATKWANGNHGKRHREKSLWKNRDIKNYGSPFEPSRPHLSNDRSKTSSRDVSVATYLHRAVWWDFRPISPWLDGRRRHAVLMIQGQAICVARSWGVWLRRGEAWSWFALLELRQGSIDWWSRIFDEYRRIKFRFTGILVTGSYSVEICSKCSW